jgi:hypothetical protein
LILAAAATPSSAARCALETRDLVTVPPLTCASSAPRGRATWLPAWSTPSDKPRLPSPDDLARLREDPEVAAFLRGDLATVAK